MRIMLGKFVVMCGIIEEPLKLSNIKMFSSEDFTVLILYLKILNGERRFNWY